MHYACMVNFCNKHAHSYNYYIAHSYICSDIIIDACIIICLSCSCYKLYIAIIIIIIIHYMQACGEIACHFQCRVVEPRIVVFYEDDSIVQAFLCAEGVSIFEVDTTTLSDCLIVLMPILCIRHTVL